MLRVLPLMLMMLLSLLIDGGNGTLVKSQNWGYFDETHAYSHDFDNCGGRWGGRC